MRRDLLQLARGAPQPELRVQQIKGGVISVGQRHDPEDLGIQDLIVGV